MTSRQFSPPPPPPAQDRRHRHHHSVASVNSINYNNNNNNNNIDEMNHNSHFDTNQIYSQDVPQSQECRRNQNNNNSNNSNNNKQHSERPTSSTFDFLLGNSGSRDQKSMNYGSASGTANGRNHYDFHHLHQSPDRAGVGGSLITDPVIRTVIATISNTVGVGILCLAFAMHNATLGICVIELVVFCFLAILSDYVLVVACEHTKQFSQQSLLSYCICGSPENMFDTPLMSKNFDADDIDKNNNRRKNVKEATKTTTKRKQKSDDADTARSAHDEGRNNTTNAEQRLRQHEGESAITRLLLGTTSNSNQPQNNAQATSKIERGRTGTESTMTATGSTVSALSPNQQPIRTLGAISENNASSLLRSSYSSVPSVTGNTDSQVTTTSNAVISGKDETNQKSSKAAKDDKKAIQKENSTRNDQDDDDSVEPIDQESKRFFHDEPSKRPIEGSVPDAADEHDDSSSADDDDDDAENPAFDFRAADRHNSSFHQQQHHHHHHHGTRSFLKRYKKAVTEVAYYRKVTFVVGDVIILIGALCLLIAYSRVIVTCCSSICYKFGCGESSNWVQGDATPWFLVWGCVFFVIVSWKRILFEPPLVAAIKVGCIVFLVLCMVIQYGQVYYSSTSNDDTSGTTSSSPSSSSSSSSTDDHPKNIRYWGFFKESLSSLATLSLVCSYHVQTPVLYSLIQPRSPAAKMKAAWISNPITTLFFIMTGLIGYLSFGELVSRDNLYNSHAQLMKRPRSSDSTWLSDDGGDVLNQYPRASGLFTAARAIMVVHFAIAFPILAVSVREAIHRLLLVVAGDSSGVRDMTDVLKTSRLSMIAESFFLVLFVQLVAAAVPGIGIVLNVGGAVSSAFSFFIVPGIVGIYVFGDVDPAVTDGSDSPATIGISTPALTVASFSANVREKRLAPDEHEQHPETSNKMNQMEEENEQEYPIAATARKTRTSLSSVAASSSLIGEGVVGGCRRGRGGGQGGRMDIEESAYRGNCSNSGDEEPQPVRSASIFTAGSGLAIHGAGGSRAESRYADSVLRSSVRNDFTGWFGARISSHMMRYLCMMMLGFGVIVTVGGTISAFLAL